MASLDDFKRHPLLLGPSAVHPLPRLSGYLGGEIRIRARREDCKVLCAHRGGQPAPSTCAGVL